MKIKLDENLPDRLVPVLTALGHEVDTVRAERLTGSADPDVWSAAQAAQRFVITQDLDFSDMRRYTPGTHAGLLLVRLKKLDPEHWTPANFFKSPFANRKVLRLAYPRVRPDLQRLARCLIEKQ